MQKLDAAQKSVRVSFKIPKSVRDEFISLAQMRGDTVSSLLRKWVDAYLEKQEKPKEIVVSSFTIMEQAFLRDPVKHRAVMEKRGFDCDALLARQAAGEV